MSKEQDNTDSTETILPSDQGTTDEGFNEEQHNEEMINAVKEIEDKVNPEVSEATEEESQEETAEEETDNSTDKESTEEDAETTNGVDFEGYAKEFAETGELSEASYKALEEQGIPKDFVDAYIAGVEAQGRLIELEVYKQVGGEETYKNMLAWATENMSADEIDAYNEASLQPGSASFRLALQGLQANYNAANASNTDNLGGGRGASLDVYQSTAQLQQDMSDPRYAVDPAFQKQVAAKLQRSNLF